MAGQRLRRCWSARRTGVACLAAAIALATAAAADSTASTSPVMRISATVSADPAIAYDAAAAKVRGYRGRVRLAHQHDGRQPISIAYLAP